MPTVVKMPKWGLTMTAGTVVGWIPAEGAEVTEGDPLLTVETEKAVDDVPAPADGVLYRIVAPEGSEVPVSDPVAVILAAGESLTDEELAALVTTVAPIGANDATRSSRKERTGQRASRDKSGRVNASPAAKKRATDLGVELSTVEATGPGGRITSDDVERAAAATVDPGPVEARVSIGPDLEVNVLQAGPASDPTLVFIHGLGGSISTWQIVLGTLTERHRVIAIDLPGHGASDRPAADDFDYSLGGLASAVSTTIAALGIDNALLVGHSLGGAVSLEMVKANSQIATGLVLIDSAGLGTDIAPALLEIMELEAGKETAQKLLQLFFEDEHLVSDRGVDEMARNQLNVGAWPAQQTISRSAFGSGLQAVNTDELLSVSTPVLVLWGENDEVIPVDHGFQAITTLPDAQLRVLADCGHVPQVERPDEVAKAIDRFARSLAS